MLGPSRSLTMVSLVQSRGYDGLDLDLEGFAYVDGRSTWPSTRPNWVAFVTELGGQLRSRGKALHVTIPPTYDGELPGMLQNSELARSAMRAGIGPDGLQRLSQR